MKETRYKSLISRYKSLRMELVSNKNELDLQQLNELIEVLEDSTEALKVLLPFVKDPGNYSAEELAKVIELDLNKAKIILINLARKFNQCPQRFNFNPNFVAARYFDYPVAKIQQDGNIRLKSLELKQHIFVGDEYYFAEDEDKIFVEFVKFLHARHYINLLDYFSNDN